MTDITSLQNPSIKQVVKLQENRRTRKKDCVTIVEGKYEFELALAGGFIPKEVFCCNELAGIEPLHGLWMNPITVSEAVFRKMSRRQNPDGWLAVFPIPHRSLDTLKPSGNPFLVLTESVEKPGNLGAMFRTADAVGVEGFLVCDPRVDLFNPNVIRSSRGTVFTVPAFETTQFDAIQWLKQNKILVIATSPLGDVNYLNVDYCQPVCIAMGSEDAGLSEYLINSSDYVVCIPMRGKVNSLNVSTSTAIILYEVLRQRSEK